MAGPLQVERGPFATPMKWTSKYIGGVVCRCEGYVLSNP